MHSGFQRFDTRLQLHVESHEVGGLKTSLTLLELDLNFYVEFSMEKSGRVLKGLVTSYVQLTYFNTKLWLHLFRKKKREMMIFHVSASGGILFDRFKVGTCSRRRRRVGFTITTGILFFA